MRFERSGGPAAPFFAEWAGENAARSASGAKAAEDGHRRRSRALPARLTRAAAVTAAVVAMAAGVSIVLPSGAALADPSPHTWYRLRMCESGDNYKINTGNGHYGAYQFALQTWRNLGMSGRPDQAAPALQDHAAYVLYEHAGWSPWPACSQREHLRRID